MSDIDVWDTFGSGEVALVHVELPPHLSGRTIMQLNVPGEIMVVSITREDHAFVPATGTEFHEGDLVHLAVLSSAMERLEELLGMEGR